jgi:hypothetical protein
VSIDASQVSLRRSTGNRSIRVFQMESDGKTVQADPGTGPIGRTGIAPAGAAVTTVTPRMTSSDASRLTEPVSAAGRCPLKGVFEKVRDTTATRVFGAWISGLDIDKPGIVVKDYEQALLFRWRSRRRVAPTLSQAHPCP